VRSDLAYIVKRASAEWRQLPQTISRVWVVVVARRSFARGGKRGLFVDVGAQEQIGRLLLQQLARLI
jgi:hypothetical protein